MEKKWKSRFTLKQQANCDFAADVFATKTQLYMEEIKIKQAKTNISLSAFL